MISNEAIVAVLTDETKDLDEKAKHLIQLANDAGGLDNITVALIHAESEGDQ